ncbi:acetyltransferase, N-acetylglutamate synthase [Brevibacillus sp. CF112]|uniref:GNAT family N-acetyltransferase n=1 Tax=Brevibacillus TaxID=55080 RepID=UPI0002715D4B|nr:GNAT family N-acetyltransferase [Brevibacillus sp. CF112]EJL45635.1 acetyltransferase, N-acetylglutamate synthase [Brevibacillus sp. CF112]
MLQIRRAHVDQAGALSDLCFRSKAYWGYSDAFMEACREDLTVTPDYIETGLVIVLEDENRLLGFMGLEQLEESGRWLLKDLFVEPDAIGKGYGKTLWEHMRKLAKELRIGSLLIHSDPHAEAFYLARGAKRIGERDNSDKAIPLRITDGFFAFQSAWRPPEPANLTFPLPRPYKNESEL